MRLALHVKDISLVNQPMRCTHYKGAICECNPNWKVLFLFVLLWMRVFTKIESWNECCCSSSSSSSTLVSFVIVFMLTRSSFSQFFDHILCILHLTWLDSARLDLTRLYLCCLLFNLRVCVVLCCVLCVYVSVCCCWNLRASALTRYLQKCILRQNCASPFFGHYDALCWRWTVVHNRVMIMMRPSYGWHKTGVTSICRQR